MSSLSQDNRTISIGDFSLGKDTFLLTGFEGSEHISDLFEFQIDVAMFWAIRGAAFHVLLGAVSSLQAVRAGTLVDALPRAFRCVGGLGRVVHVWPPRN